MSFSNFLETEILDHVFGGNAYTAPSTIYLSLHTANPTEDASGGGEVSTSSSAYARQSAAFTVSGNSASTNAAVEWTTATSNWGTITHIGVWDAASSGNMLAYSALTDSKTVAIGDVLRINSGQLTITLD